MDSPFHSVYTVLFNQREKMHQAENVGGWYFMLCNAGCICNFQEHFFLVLCVSVKQVKDHSTGEALNSRSL